MTNAGHNSGIGADDPGESSVYECGCLLTVSGHYEHTANPQFPPFDQEVVTTKHVRWRFDYKRAADTRTEAGDEQP